MRDRQRTEEEIDALTQGNEGLRIQLVEETKKYERMLRDRNASVKNLAETEKGARRQGAELTARDATITQLRDQLEKVTADSIKKSARIEDLRGDSSKKCSKVDDLRNRRTGLRNKLDEQAALLLEERDSEMANMRELLNVGTEDITSL
jgi:phage shock protein A